MFASLQPSRPVIPQQPHSPRQHFQHQQVRSLHEAATTPPVGRLAPRCQIEAMPPPTAAPAVPARLLQPLSHRPQPMPYDAALHHPVFHSAHWHRPPAALGLAPLSAALAAADRTSPVAAGYAWSSAFGRSPSQVDNRSRL